MNLRPTSVDVRLHATLSDALGGVPALNLAGLQMDNLSNEQIKGKPGAQAKLPKYIEISQEALLAAAIVQGKSLV